MSWDSSSFFRQIGHLSPELIESTDEYVIYSVKLSEDEIYYFGYSKKWNEYNMYPTLEETKEWLSEIDKVNMVAPKDIYYGKVLKEFQEIPWYIFESFGIGEEEDFSIPKDQTSLLIKTHADEIVDWGERGLVICSVWWNNSPVMIIMKGGRGLRDAEEISINDSKLYKEMISWLLSFKKEEPIYAEDINEPQKRLSVFYNYFVESLIKEDE